MSNTDKLREIAFKWGCRTIPSHDFTDDKYEDKSKELLSDLTALISENYYPKEFVLWLVIQNYWGMDILTCKWTNDEPTAFQEEKTTDELYEMWKENEK